MHCCRYVFIVSPSNCFRNQIEFRKKNNANIRAELTELISIVTAFVHVNQFQPWLMQYCNWLETAIFL